ncbi:hypothetical protein ACP70R_045532 [Stipagrostis hirtigluma subsp. patula]
MESEGDHLGMDSKTASIESRNPNATTKDKTLGLRLHPSCLWHWVIRAFFRCCCSSGHSALCSSNEIRDLVRQWIKGAYKNMTFDQPDYEIHNAKPRPINQDMLQGLSVLENKLADLMQGQRHIAEEERNVCPTVDEQGTSGSNSKPCTLQRLGSVRVTQNGEDESFDISFYLDSGSEQYCASTSVDDITGSVTLCCPTTAANEITGSVVLKQASLTKDREVYATHLTDNDASVTQLCEEQQQMQAHFGASICAVRALADCPIYSRHSSFKEEGCHEMPALGAEPAV